MSKTSLVSSTLQALMIYSDLWSLKLQTSNHTGVLYTYKQSDAPDGYLHLVKTRILNM
jgi:hypothetical protein